LRLKEIKLKVCLPLYSPPCHGCGLLHALHHCALVTAPAVCTPPPHAPCCCVPRCRMCHLAVLQPPTAHTAHIAASTTTTAAITPQQSYYHDHHDHNHATRLRCVCHHMTQPRCNHLHMTAMCLPSRHMTAMRPPPCHATATVRHHPTRPRRDHCHATLSPSLHTTTMHPPSHP
jgi:hypothetical protein